MISFPSLEECLELYRTVIEKFGGTEGIRDMGLLESALYRPQTGYYESLSEMAAALMESLLLNHPFVDGNKRVAFFLTEIFLRTNGFKISVSAKAGKKFLEKVITSKNDRFEMLKNWIEKNMTAL